MMRAPLLSPPQAANESAMPSSGVMISRELQVTLQLAMSEAANRRHEYVCMEHLLYAMLHDATASNILRHCGADLARLRKRLAKYLDDKIERMPGNGQVSPRYALGRAAGAAARGGARAVGRTVRKSTAATCWSRCSPSPTPTPFTSCKRRK